MTRTTYSTETGTMKGCTKYMPQRLYANIGKPMGRWTRDVASHIQENHGGACGYFFSIIQRDAVELFLFVYHCWPTIVDRRSGCDVMPPALAI